MMSYVLTKTNIAGNFHIRDEMKQKHHFFCHLNTQKKLSAASPKYAPIVSISLKTKNFNYVL